VHEKNNAAPDDKREVRELGWVMRLTSHTQRKKGLGRGY